MPMFGNCGGIKQKDDSVNIAPSSNVSPSNAKTAHILRQCFFSCRTVTITFLMCLAIGILWYDDIVNSTTPRCCARGGSYVATDVGTNLDDRVRSDGIRGSLNTGRLSAGSPPRCNVTSALVNDVPVGDILSSTNLSYINMCHQAAAAGAGARGMEFFSRAVRECSGIREERQTFRTKEWENRLRRHEDPIMMPMHGGVVPSRMARLALQLSRRCPTPPVEQPHLWPNDTVIVELGCGNAALLSVVAPRAPHIVGVGTDVAKALVEHGSAFYPHLAVHRAIGAPMVPAGAATCVYSLGVLMLLSTSATCNYIAEGLRLLQPGGRMILHGVPRRLPKVGRWTTFRNTFFEKVVRTASNTSGEENHVVFLPACMDIGRLVRSVSFLSSKHLALYPPGDQFMSVVVERNEEPFPCTTTSSSAWPNSITKSSFLRGERARRANITAVGVGNVGNTSELLFPPEWSSRRLRCLLTESRAQC
jgi:hypothetical protein